jgi:DNA-binding CsgD family transcriptional regulator
MQALWSSQEGFSRLAEPIPINPRSRPTPREFDVLQLICEGRTSKQVAARLGISLKTAVTHRARLLEKAGAQNAVQLLRWALKNGLVSLDDSPHLVPARQTVLTERR